MTVSRVPEVGLAVCVPPGEPLAQVAPAENRGAEVVERLPVRAVLEDVVGARERRIGGGRFAAGEDPMKQRQVPPCSSRRGVTPLTGWARALRQVAGGA